MLSLLKDRSFYKEMTKLALPIAVQTMLMAAFQLIDATMVARLGDHAIDAVNLAGRWTFIMMITMFGIGSGAAILYSQFWGAKDEQGIRAIFGLAMTNTMAIAAVFGIAMFLIPEQMIRLFAGADKPEVVRLGASFLRVFALNCLVFAFNYTTTMSLRSTEEVRIPLITSVMSIVVNTSLNFVLIYGMLGAPALGVQGAAISTTVANVVQCVALNILVRRRGHVVFQHVREWFRWEKDIVRRFYAAVFPVLINESLWVLGNSVYTFVFARLGASELAAYSLYGSVDQLLFAFVIGLSSACGVMVGKSVGAGDEQAAWKTAKQYISVGVLVAMALGLIEVVLRVPLIAIIQPENAATGETAKQLLLISSAAMPLKMLSMLLIVAIFRSGGKPMIGTVIDVGCAWFIGAPLVVLMGLYVKIPFIWVFMFVFAEDVVKVILGLVMFFRRTWIRRLTRDLPVEVELEGALLEPEA